MTEDKFKEVLVELSDKLSKVTYKGDLGDIGNEIGVIIAKYFDKADYDDLDSFISGLRHGVSLVDGTHDNPVIYPSFTKDKFDKSFDKAVEYAQENYVNRDGNSYLLLGNVAELIAITTGEFIAWTELEKYKKS